MKWFRTRPGIAWLAPLFLVGALMLLAPTEPVWAKGKGGGNGGGNGGGGDGGSGSGGGSTVTYNQTYLDEAARDDSGTRFPLYDNFVSHASAINNGGTVAAALKYLVPNPEEPGTFSEADAACIIRNLVVSDLNDELNALGKANWNLWSTNDLNDLEMVVGRGTYFPSTAGPDQGYVVVPQPSGGSAVVLITGEWAADQFAWSCFPRAINDAGLVVGTYQKFQHDSGTHSFIFDVNTGDFIDVETLMGVSDSADVEVHDINHNQQIAGEMNVNGNQQAFRYTISTDVLERIPAFKKSRSSVLSGSPALNDAGTLVGQARTGNFDFSAFRLTSSGQLSNLGTLGGNESQATGITANDLIVGTADVADGQPRAIFLFSDAQGMRRVVFTGESSTLNPGSPKINDSQVILSGYPGAPFILMPQ